MRILIPLFAVLLLAACTTPSDSTTDLPPETSSSSDASTEIVLADAPLEHLPSELSIPHFRTMRLSGSALSFDSIESDNSVYTRHRISYRSNGLKITGIMNIPKGDGPFPLLIFNHGYIAPSIYTQGRGLKREQDYMARQGFAVLHTDYRGHAGSDPSPMTENVYDGNLEYAMDSANAILAVRAANLPNVDASQVGMLGHSLGGGVTMAVLTGKPELVSAAVLYAPVHGDVWENFTRWRAERDEGDRTLAAFKTRPENPAFWDNLSPQTFFADIDVPVMLFQGSNDKDVPKAWSDTLDERMKSAGVDLTYVEYPGEGHEFGPQWNDFMRQSADFFKENLSGQ